MAASAHAALCQAAAAALAAVPASRRPKVTVGFDGFVDHIIDVVAKRESPTRYTAVPTIADYGARISAAAGKSANFELVIKQSKIGGNGPIMANALCSYDYQVTAIGVLGGDSIDPVFAPLASRAARTISLGPPAVTDALEFSDGKLMLGKLLPMEAVTYQRLVEKLGADGLMAVLRDADGIATVNWTMSLGMTEIWQRLAEDVLPGLRSDRPRWFIDLADPAKRTIADLQAAVAAMKQLQRHVDVVLGMNEMECRQVLRALDRSWPEGKDDLAASRAGCEAVKAATGVSIAVCHMVKSAAVAWDGGASAAEGFFEPKPKITTGAGDHFNAGFFAAVLAGISPDLAIQIGAATSGTYVRSAVSPARAQVVAFLRSHG